MGKLLAGGAGSLLSLIKMMHSLGGGNLEELGIALNVGLAIQIQCLLVLCISNKRIVSPQFNACYHTGHNN